MSKDSQWFCFFDANFATNYSIIVKERMFFKWVMRKLFLDGCNCLVNKKLITIILNIKGYKFVPNKELQFTLDVDWVRLS